MQTSFWPYEELEVQILSSDTFLLRSPWFAREIRATGETASKWKKTFEGRASPADQRECWMQIFGKNPQDPLSYILPRQLLGISGRDQHRPSGKERGLRNLLASFEHGADGFGNMLKKELLSEGWDTEAILEFSRVHAGVGHDPLSVFSALRRYQCLESQQLDQTAAMYDYAASLGAKGKDQFRKAAVRIASQHYEVARRSHGILSPALAIAQSSASALKGFLQTERGHDQMIFRGIEALGAHPETPLPVTTLLLDAFQLTAHSNFLAFAFIVSLFEESFRPETDPLAKFFRDGGESEAAAIFQNRSEKSMGLALLSNMAPVNSDYVREAVAFAMGTAKALNIFTALILYSLKEEDLSLTPHPSN